MFQRIAGNLLVNQAVGAARLYVGVTTGVQTYRWNAGYTTSVTWSKFMKGDASSGHIASNMTFPVKGER
jgi:hypothetical protein